jgi:integrase
MFKWKPGKLAWLKSKWKLPSMAGADSADWRGQTIMRQFDSRPTVANTPVNTDRTPRLMASLMYGAGLHLMEWLRLRVQDIDFSRIEILVRDGKGAKDRITMLPESLKVPLQIHLKGVKAILEKDLAEGWAIVRLYSLYKPEVTNSL